MRTTREMVTRRRQANLPRVVIGMRGGRRVWGMTRRMRSARNAQRARVTLFARRLRRRQRNVMTRAVGRGSYHGRDRFAPAA